MQSVLVGALIIKNGRSLIVIDEYPGDIFFVSTRLLLWLPRDLTQFFYHEWLLEVVVEDWDIRPILLMHFLK